MYKNFIAFCLLFFSLPAHAHKLTHPLLAAADKAGMFDRHIIDILKVRQTIIDFVHGKYVWQGYTIEYKTTTKKSISGLLRHPEIINGVGFIVLDPQHPDIDTFITQAYQQDAYTFIKQRTSHSLVQRQQHTSYQGQFTGSYAIHPITKQHIPIYIADYSSDCIDTRTNKVHLGIPAHSEKDFLFAQTHGIEPMLVVTGHHSDAAEDLPALSKDHKKLLKAFTRYDEHCFIINSDFLNGSIKDAHEKIVSYLTDHGIGHETNIAIIYDIYGKQYSIENLKNIEASFKQENRTLSSEQKELFVITMNAAQEDFLSIVEQFLEGIKTTKDLMIDLIKESCELRSNTNCFLLRWSQYKTTEPEKIVFKRDIVSFHDMTHFCIDLANFLGDLASSCPRALDHLRQLKK